MDDIVFESWSATNEAGLSEKLKKYVQMVTEVADVDVVPTPEEFSTMMVNSPALLAVSAGITLALLAAVVVFFVIKNRKSDEDDTAADEMLMSEISAFAAPDEMLLSETMESEPADKDIPVTATVPMADTVEESASLQQEDPIPVFEETTVSTQDESSVVVVSPVQPGVDGETPALDEKELEKDETEISSIEVSDSDLRQVGDAETIIQKEEGQISFDKVPSVSTEAAAPKKARRKIAGHTWTHEAQGGRDHMEDAHFVTQSSETLVVGVLDGCGGGRASSLGRNILSELASKKRLCVNDQLLIDALTETEKKLLAASRKQGNWPDASTAVLGAVNEDHTKLNIAWVGDSRAVLATQQGAKLQAHLMTSDHNAENAKEEARIKQAGGSVGRSKKEASASGRKKMFAKVVGSSVAFKTHAKNPKRVFPGGITLTRALGGLPLKYATPKLIIAQPESISRSLDGSERFLILGSDGIFEALSVQAAVDAVAPHLPPATSSISPAEALINAAVASGSSDNLTVVVLQLFSS